MFNLYCSTFIFIIVFPENKEKKNNKKYKIDPLNSSELEGWQARVSTGIGCHSETCSHFDNPLQAKKNPCLCLCYLLCLYSMFLCFHSTFQYYGYVHILRFYHVYVSILFLSYASVHVYVLCLCSVFLSHVSVYAYVYVLYFFFTASIFLAPTLGRIP